MRRYDALVVWSTYKKNSVTLIIKSEWVRNIFAEDIIEAAQIALDKHKHKGLTGPSISMIWYQ